MLTWNTRRSNIGLFNLVLFVGLYNTSVSAIPINAVASYEGIKYPIHVACECIFTLYVDGVYVGEGNKENYDPKYGSTEWNDTKKYYPVIRENEPKIIAFNGMGGQYPVFPNGFIMDMNEGKDYTKYNEWKCKDFSKTVEKTPPSNWFTYDYDDSDWSVSTSYGANYQNNSFQMFETPRYFITLNAEWLWTETNSDAVIYCRKKNPNTHTLLIPTTVPPTTTHPATTSAAPTHVEKKVHTTVLQTTHPATTSAAPTHVEKKVHTTVLPTTHPATTTAAPTHVEKKVHTTMPPPTTHPATTTVVPTHVEKNVHTTVSPTTHTATTSAAPTHMEKKVHTTVLPTTAAPTHVEKKVHTTVLPTTAAPTHVEKKVHTTVLPTTHPATTTAAPTHVEKKVHTSVLPTTVVPTHVEKKVHTTMPPPTRHPATTTAAPTHVEKKAHTTVLPTTAAPTHVEKKVHTTVSPTTHPATTTAVPTHVEKKVHTTVSPTTHPATTTVASKPLHIETHNPKETHIEKIIVHTTVPPTTHPETTDTKNYNIVISPRIKIIINQIKRSHARSNIHISSLLQKIKLYHDDLKLYKKLLFIRLHLQHHYKTIIRYALHEYHLNKKPHTVKVPQFVKTLRKLNNMITQIEHNIKFIKGNHKYILLNILEKLKIMYKKDTRKYLRYFMIHNMKKYHDDTMII
jgi:hypothetical protein